MKPALALLFLLGVSAAAHADTDALPDTIPTNAVKVVMPPLGAATLYYYYKPGAPQTTKTLVAREVYNGNALVRRELWKDGQLNGMLRDWFPNGQMKTETPHKNGLEEGTCREWNDKGQLISQYEMKGGEGTQRVYSDDGYLKEEDQMQNAGYNMLSVACYPDGHAQWVGRLKGVAAGGLAADGPMMVFREDGTLQSLTWASNGPNISFTADGSVNQKEWSLEGNKTTEADYAVAATKNPAIPPYYADTERYKECVTPEIVAIVARCKTQAAVKIPLEFDRNGNPIQRPR